MSVYCTVAIAVCDLETSLTATELVVEPTTSALRGSPALLHPAVACEWRVPPNE